MGRNYELLVIGGGTDILANHAGDLLALLLVAMQGNLPVSAVAETIYPYPTMTRGEGQATWQLI